MTYSFFALYYSGVPWAGSTTFPADKHTKDAGFLEAYAHERWEVRPTCITTDEKLYCSLIYNYKHCFTLQSNVSVLTRAGE